jgi:hypothetical protein
MRRALHLGKRFLGSLDPRPLSADEAAEIRQVLLASEWALFQRFNTADQRHAMQVLQRFDSLVATAPIEARRAAVLHDIGKIESDLGLLGRVLATIVGPRTSRFRIYCEHERRSIELLTQHGSSTLTVDLIAGGGDESLQCALRAADEI